MKFLSRNCGIGYSKKWSDVEKEYADSIRMRYFN